MYYTKEHKPDRPITHKEAIIMIKQLGMMHILYYTKRQLIEIMRQYEHWRKMLGNKPPEKVILSWLDTENKLINHLSEWENNYKRDMELKKKKKENSIITL